MIRANDPKLLQVEGEVFRDEDFEASSGDDDNKASKKVTYKDLIREDVLKKASKGANEDSSDEESGQIFKKKRGKGETVAEEEERLKREFKDKALVEEDQDDSDDGFLKKKKDESEDEADSIPDDLENLKPEKVLKVAKKKAKKELNMETDIDLLKRFYGDENQLDSTDKFLRNYILLQCWKDKGNNSKSKLQEVIDAEDEKRDEEMEDFE